MPVCVWLKKTPTHLRERRNLRRVKTNFHAHFVALGARPVAIVLTEASPTGFRLSAAQPLPLHKESFVRLERGSESLEVPVILTWQRKTRERSYPIECGGRFGELSRKVRRDLSSYLFGDPTVLRAEQPEARQFIRVTLRDSLMGEDFVISDVSETGVGALSREEIPPGTHMEINLRLGKVQLQCKSRVVRCIPQEDGQAFQIGLSFEGMDDKARLRLVEALNQLLEQRAR
jgi:c-di-GMP-binding flagellar brake protein YcgR